MTEETVYARAVADWEHHRAARQAEQKRHDTAVAQIDAGLREAERVMMLAETVSPEAAKAYEIARTVLQVEWLHRPRFDGAMRKHTPEVLSCFQDAIDDLRTGGERLAREYLGVKAYDRWSSQRTDCEYGMGPSHGSIWFRIGLRNPKRPLTEAERLACIQWLRVVAADPDRTLT